LGAWAGGFGLLGSSQLRLARRRCQADLATGDRQRLRVARVVAPHIFEAARNRQI
jgi:hypothetical protein